MDIEDMRKSISNKAAWIRKMQRYLNDKNVNSDYVNLCIAEKEIQIEILNDKIKQQRRKGEQV